MLRRLIFAAIVGIPPGAGSTASSPTDWARIACTEARARAGTCHPDLVPEVDESGPSPSIRPSCDTDTGLAFPLNRIVRVAELIDATESQGIASSICQGDFQGPMAVVIRRLAALRR